MRMYDANAFADKALSCIRMLWEKTEPAVKKGVGSVNRDSDHNTEARGEETRVAGRATVDSFDRHSRSILFCLTLWRGQC